MTDWPLDWRDLVDEAVRRRKAEGHTQKSLAVLAGVSVPTVNAFERGDIKLRLEKVFDILDAVGMIVLPGAPDSFPAFVHAARKRWEELVAPLPADHPSRQPLGHVEYAYALEGLDVDLTLSRLRDVFSRLPKTSGWTPFWVPTRDELKPVIRDGLIECWLGRPDTDRAFNDAAHSDFWQVTGELNAFLQRGYQEDGSSNQDPGTIFDLTLPIWRTAEVLLHASHLVQALEGDPGTVIRYTARYTGLEGRELLPWAAPRLRHSLHERYQSRSGRVDLAIATTPRALIQDLESVVGDCVAPLYERFDGFEVTPDFVSAQIAELRRAGLNT
jgi:transcriptional regulator with XRE-family HTH domain